MGGAKPCDENRKYNWEADITPVLKETIVSWIVREKMVLSPGQGFGTKGQFIFDRKETGPSLWGKVMS